MPVIKQAPSVGRILAMVAFALSCFGILVFLWLSFGGSVPLQPKGYRVTVAFPEATQLAQEADVRISGVQVGSVKKTEPNTQTGLTDTVLEIDARYAPLPEGHPRDPAPEDAARRDLRGAVARAPAAAARDDRRRRQLPQGQVRRHGAARRDPARRSTRRRAQRFSDLARPAGRGGARAAPSAINDALALLTPFAENTDEVLKVLRQQSGATRAFVRDTGEVFDALSERKGQLRELIAELQPRLGGDRQPQRRARRHLPRAARPSCARARTTTQRLTKFAKDTNPLITSCGRRRARSRRR